MQVDERFIVDAELSLFIPLLDGGAEVLDGGLGEDHFLVAALFVVPCVGDACRIFSGRSWFDLAISFCPLLLSDHEALNVVEDECELLK